MNTNHQQQENSGHGPKEIAKMREFAYRAPSPDSEPPTMQEQGESQETEGVVSAQESNNPKTMEEAEARDLSPDDLDDSPQQEQ